LQAAATNHLHLNRRPSASRTPSTSHNGAGLHILLVEDDVETAESMALLLRCFGHWVELATDGPGALAMALRSPPDVVLLDLSLPGMDGWALARHLQEQRWLKTPFLIALTGHGSAEDGRRSTDAGIDLHLVKPVDIDFLHDILERFHRIVMPIPETPPGASLLPAGPGSAAAAFAVGL
jgi:CheY-like chemotaxis protein